MRIYNDLAMEMSRCKSGAAVEERADSLTHTNWHKKFSGDLHACYVVLRTSFARGFESAFLRMQAVTPAERAEITGVWCSRSAWAHASALLPRSLMAFP